ncbi:plant synaptotagmin, partial [Nannochloropsis oceanica]
IRVELNPLMPDVPGFGAIAITFMEEPFMDFSFKIANMDVMAVGAPDMSVADMVTDIIKENVLKGLLLYPAQLVIPMIADIDLERLRNPAPIGILMLTIRSARGLRIADIRSSDAYVKIRYGLNQSFKTRVIRADLNPEWNEEFQLKIFAKDQPIVFTVKDYDIVGKDDDLGDYSLRIDDLVPLKPVDLDLALCHTTQGSIQVRLLYYPVSRLDADGEEDDVFDEAIAELEEDLAIASMWAYEESDEEEGEEGAGAAATKAKSSLRSVNRIGGTQKGILTVEGLGLGGYSSKGAFMGGSKVLLRLALGTRIVRTTPEKTPCRDPIFPDQFTFNIDDKVVGTFLDVAIVENQLLGPSKVLGTTSIDLSTFTRHPGKTEADWHIHTKGKVVDVHIRAYFSPLQSTGSSAVA